MILPTPLVPTLGIGPRPTMTQPFGVGSWLLDNPATAVGVGTFKPEGITLHVTDRVLKVILVGKKNSELPVLTPASIPGRLSSYIDPLSCHLE
jgi:hypothetical protein